MKLLSMDRYQYGGLFGIWDLMWKYVLWMKL